MGRRAQAQWVLASTAMAVALGLVADAAAARPVIPRVSVYMNQDSGVLDSAWDSGPVALFRQLSLLSSAEPAQSTDVLRDKTSKSTAWVVPVQNGDLFFATTEDMQHVAGFVARGGLVLLCDSRTGDGAATRDFVQKALGLEGKWKQLKAVETNAYTSPGKPALSEHAKAFLPAGSLYSWPQDLEDARITSVHTVAHHEDPRAVVVPLYTARGSDTKVVVQAFGKVGVRGAVVWLGYSWKEGSQDGWGRLLHKLVTDFANGEYKAPAHPLDLPLHFDTVLADFGADQKARSSTSRSLRFSWMPST